jgi:hypothetical protein
MPLVVFFAGLYGDGHRTMVKNENIRRRKNGACFAHSFVDGAGVCFDGIRQMACFAFEANRIN